MRKIEILYPVGYPFVLFKADTEYIAAVSKLQARKNTAVKALPTVVKINKLVKEMGHSETHRFLKGFSDHWVVKNGQVFFKTLNTQVR